MNRKLVLALFGLMTVACGEVSHSPQPEAALATVAASSAEALLRESAHLPGGPSLRPTRVESLLQDTARTVTRRIIADAEFDYDISPDGKHAIQTDWEITGDLTLRDLETGEVRHLTRNQGRFDPGEAEDARFSPDGKRVAYTWYDEAQPTFYKLGVVDIEGTDPRLIYRDRATSWIQAEDWSPDGRQILAFRSVAESDAGELLLISAEDGGARLLKSFADPATGVSGGACFSPDGRYVAYQLWRESPDNNDIFVIDVATGEEHPLVATPTNDEMLGWAPDGRHFLFRSDRSGTPGAWLLPVTGGRGSGDPWLVKPDMWRTSGVRFSQDGRYYFKVSTQRQQVYVVGLDPETKSIIGSPMAVSASSTGNSIAGVWSPDGRHLAYVADGGPGNSLERVVIRSMETGDEKHFELREPSHVGMRGWTPDGRAVVVRISNPGYEDNPATLYRIDVQTGRREVLSDPRQSIPEIYPRFALGQESLVYLVSEENDEGQAAFHLLRYDVETGDSTVLFGTPYGAWGQILSPALSPDGQTLAFGYSPVVGSDPHSLILLPINGDAPQELPIEGTRGIAWMPDGEALLFQRFAGVGPVWETWYLDLSDGEPQPIGLTARGGSIRMDVHPNGRSIAYTSGTGGTELWVMEDFLPGASRTGETEPLSRVR
jgi:Tol biopolymer transport system component